MGLLTTSMQSFSSSATLLSGAVTFTCSFRIARRRGSTARLYSLGRVLNEDTRELREYLFSASRIPSTATGVLASTMWGFGRPSPSMAFVVESINNLVLTSTNTVTDTIQLAIDLFYCSGSALSSSKVGLLRLNSSGAAVDVSWMLPNSETSVYERLYLEHRLQISLNSLKVDISSDGTCFRIQAETLPEPTEAFAFKSLLVSVDIFPELQALLDPDDGYWQSQAASGIYLQGTIRPDAPTALTEVRIPSAPVFDECPASRTLVLDNLALQPVIVWSDLWVQLTSYRQLVSSSNQLQGARRWNALPFHLEFVATNNEGVETVCAFDFKVVCSKWVRHNVAQAVVNASAIKHPQQQADGSTVFSLADHSHVGPFRTATVPIYNTHVYSWTLHAPPQRLFERVGNSRMSLNVDVTLRMTGANNTLFRAQEGALLVTLLNATSRSSTSTTIDASFSDWVQYDEASGLRNGVVTLRTASIFPDELANIRFTGIEIGLLLPIGVDTNDVGVTTNWNDTATVEPQAISVGIRTLKSSEQSFRLVSTDQTAPVIECPIDVKATLLDGQEQVEVDLALLQPVVLRDDATQVLELTELPSTFYSVGVTSVTLATVDEAGNSASCSFLVVVAAASVNGPISGGSAGEPGSGTTAGMAMGLAALVLVILVGLFIRRQQRR